MSRLTPILAIMALFLGLVSAAHAQSGATPTVETVAITSNPGTAGIHTPSHEHTPAPPLASPDKNIKNIEEKP